MAVNADTLLDRMRLKEQVTRWRIIAIIALVLVAVVATQRFGDFGAISEGNEYIARFTVKDMIIDDVHRSKTLAGIKENDDIKALVVWIDSPGGTVVGGQQLYNEFQEISEKKPVVGVIRTIGTSGAYMAAIGTDHIIASEGSLTGSIGVVMQALQFTGTLEKLGIEPITIKTSPLKAVPSPFEDLSSEARQSLERLINDYHDVFKDMVAEARDFTDEQVAQVADGRVFTGRQALELKLIDQLGGEEEALSWLESEKGIDISLKVKDVEVKYPKPDWLEEFGSFFRGSNPVAGMIGQPPGLVAIWHPALADQ